MIAVAQPHGVGVPGASRPVPGWLVLSSAIFVRLLASSRRVRAEGGLGHAGRLDAAAHAVAAILALLGARPLICRPSEGDALAAWLTAWDDLSRDLLARPTPTLDPVARGTIVALAAYVEDTVRWVPDA